MLRNIRRMILLFILWMQLGKVQQKQFSIYTWQENKESSECGTVCCAMGWACHNSIFKRMGLRLRKVWAGWSPEYKGHNDYSAASHFFDISYEEAEYLFAPYEYPQIRVQPNDVRKRLWALIKYYNLNCNSSSTTSEREAFNV